MMPHPQDEPFAPEDLRAWQKDFKGQAFWAAIHEMIEAARDQIRVCIKKQKFHEATEYQAHLETLEEILTLPDKIILDAAETKARSEELAAAPF